MSTVVARKASFQAGKLPDFHVTAQDPHKEGRYFRIGAAWRGTTDKGVEYISIRLNALPGDLRLRLFPPLEDDPPLDEPPG